MELLGLDPVFLFFVFAVAFVVGRLIFRNPAGWKYVLLAFGAIFFYQELLSAGTGVFLTSVAGIGVSYYAMHPNPRLRLPRLRIPQIFADTPDRSSEGERFSSRETGYSSAEEAQADFEAQFKKKKPSGQRNASNQQSKTNAEAERLRRENERLKQEAEQARKEAQAAKKDTRTPIEILGLQAGYTQADLKRAYRQKVQQWHTDKLAGRAPELIAQAEEEMKKIIEAYERLVD